MNFEEYLQSKKINPRAFADAEQEVYQNLKKVFDQVHPASFTAQKLFLINPLRRKYKWFGEAKEVAKPKILLKPKFTKPNS